MLLAGRPLQHRLLGKRRSQGGIPKFDTVILTLASRTHTHTRSIVLTLNLSYSYSAHHTHTQFFTLTLSPSYSYSVPHTHTQFLILILGKSLPKSCHYTIIVIVSYCNKSQPGIYGQCSVVIVRVVRHGQLQRNMLPAYRSNTLNSKSTCTQHIVKIKNQVFILI